MSNRRKLFSRLRKYEDKCNICGEPDNGETLYCLTMQAYAPKDVAPFAKHIKSGEGSSHYTVKVGFMSYCPEHTDDEIANAGFLPPAMIDTFQNSREVIDVTVAMAKNAA